jgi:hypothetical protein
MKLPNKIILIAFLGILFSCSSNLDFDQVQDLETTPVYNIPLGYFTISSNGFISDAATPIVSVSEIIEYRIFDNSLLRDNLVRQNFSIEIINTFNRAFIISIGFLDENDNQTFPSSSYTVNANQQDFKEQIVIDNIDTNNSNVKNTKKLSLTINLEDQSTPLRASNGFFNFKSSTTVYLKTSIKDEE